MNLFDDAPRYEEITPVLSMQRFDDILGCEAELHETEEKQSAEHIYQVSQLRARVAKAEGITEEEAGQRLSKDKSLVERYAGELAFMAASGPNKTTSQLRMVTLFVQTRGFTRAEDGSMVKIENWTEDQTSKQPKKVLDAISAFIEKERYGWDPKKTEAGKQRPAA
jgi:hypothetical protein